MKSDLGENGVADYNEATLNRGRNFPGGLSKVPLLTYHGEQWAASEGGQLQHDGDRHGASIVRDKRTSGGEAGDAR